MDQQNRLTDKDIATDLLCGLKEMALSYHMASVEAANPRVRTAFESAHDDAMKQQWELWQTMHSKGWYQLQGETNINPNVQHNLGSPGGSAGAGQRWS